MIDIINLVAIFCKDLFKNGLIKIMDSESTTF
jgi:hypothetical protein